MKKSVIFGTAGFIAVGVALIGGTCIATGNCQGKMTTSPTARTEKPEAKPEKKEIRWLTSLEDAKKESAMTGKPIFVDFHATWCPPCKMMEEQTFPDAKVIEESQNWVMLKIDTDIQQDVAIKYRISSLPTLAVLNSDGTPVTGAPGFLSPSRLIEFLDYAQNEIKSK